MKFTGPNCNRTLEKFELECFNASPVEYVASVAGGEFGFPAKALGVVPQPTGRDYAVYRGAKYLGTYTVTYTAIGGAK